MEEVKGRNTETAELPPCQFRDNEVAKDVHFGVNRMLDARESAINKIVRHIQKVIY